MTIPTDLHEKYATLTAKRPELAVEGLSCGAYWRRVYTWPRESVLEPDEAAALILARWLNEVPCDTLIVRSLTDTKWNVWKHGYAGPNDGKTHLLDALYEYHMERA